jgi:hypothetical protein
MSPIAFFDQSLYALCAVITSSKALEDFRMASLLVGCLMFGLKAPLLCNRTCAGLL